MEDYRLDQSGQEVQNILDGAAMQVDLTAETERAELAEQTLQGNIDIEERDRKAADLTLQGNIDAEELRAKAAEKQNADDIDALEEKVPSGASSSNKLATESYVDDSVATATATFRGTYNLVSDLHLTVDATEQQIATALALAISTADNNDYCFVQVPTSSETPTEIKEIDRYKFNGTAWSFEYKLNNSGFTAAQWAAINSGITSGDVLKLAALPTNAQLNTLLAGKQDVLTFDNVPTQDSIHPVKSGGVYSAIDDEKTARETADSSLSSAIEAILLLIPSAATSLNKLADKAFVNSSIATASATFRGTYNLVTDLSLTVSATHAQIATALAGAVSDEDNNDYAFVQIPTADATPTQIAKTERYKYNGTAWEYEYDLNNSGYTAAQWAAINSGITEALVTKLSALPTNAELTSALGVLTSSITTINQKIPSAASQANQLVDTAAMESYIVQVIDVLTASFNVTSTDGHVTVSISQVDGKITSVAVSTSDIASASDLSLIAGRVTTAEGNISTNATDIANLQAAYAALTQSNIVVVSGALPSSGQQQNIIYRQPDQDHTPPQFYSDYMWNGTAWVLMATYNNAIDPRPKKGSQNLVTSGGVFDNMGALDVSELNATENPHTIKPYATLDAALADIPSDYQKGGMSIKYVQTSDNKYVQYRYVGTSTVNADFTNVVNWAEIADTFNQDKPFAIGPDVYKDRIVECYLEGLNPAKSYRFENVRYFVYEDYKAIQCYVYENESNTIVARCEFQTTQNFIGIAQLVERNSSGISGYALLNIKTIDTDTPQPSAQVNIEKCSDIYNSPFIYRYLNPDVSLQEFNQYKASNSLHYSVFKSVSSNKVYERCLNIQLTGINENEEYHIGVLKHSDYGGGYECADIQIMDSSNNVVALSQTQTNIDFYDIVKIKEHNGSGITGTALLNIKTTDTDNVTAVFDNKKIKGNYEKEVRKSALSDYSNSTYLANKIESYWYGNILNDGNNGFSQVTAETVVAFESIAFEHYGLLSTIKFKAKGSQMKFGIGFIDQRNIAVLRKTFIVDCTPNVLEEKDVTGLGINVEAGETLVCLFSSVGTSICFADNTEESQSVQMLYSHLGAALERYGATYGARANLQFEQIKISSPFAEKSSLEKVSDNTELSKQIAIQALSENGLVKDDNGNYYKIIVDNGQLSLKPLVFSKVLVLCNSLGVNGRVYSLGWCSRRGMASSRYGLDYKSHLENGLKQKDVNAEVVLRNIWNWEADFDSISVQDLMDGYLTSDIDCIIFRAGENIPEGREGVTENVVSLMSYCKSQCPDALLYITSERANEGNHDLELLNAASQLGIPYIDVSDDGEWVGKYRIHNGDYVEGDYTPDGGITWDTSIQVLYKVSGGVVGHDNDVGMLQIANDILSGLKYSQLDLLRNIAVGNIGGYTCEVANQWVVNGIVNVKSNGNAVTVVDSDGNTIIVTNHNDGFFTFIMPNKDVIVSVS